MNIGRYIRAALIVFGIAGLLLSLLMLGTKAYATTVFVLPL